MTLKIAPALKYGWRRLKTPTGKTLVGIAAAYQLVFSMLFSSLGAAAGVENTTASSFWLAPFAIPLSPGVLLVAILVLLLAGLWLYVTVLRGVATDRTDSLPSETYSRRIGTAAVTIIAAGLIGGLLTLVGLLLLVIPGIIVAISLSFTAIFVAVEDDGPVEAIKHSWRMAKGNRIELFVLGLAVGILVQIASFVGGFVGGVLSFFVPVVGWLVVNAVFGATWVYQSAAMVGAYRQLKGGDGAPEAEQPTAEGGTPADDHPAPT